MNTFKKGLLLTALAASLTLTAAVPAQAATFASSILNISNFRLLHSGAGGAYSTTDFATLAGVNDAHATAMLNNVFANGVDSKSITSPLSPNVAQQCVGACPAIPPTFLPLGGMPPVLNTYGYADQAMLGAAIVIGANPAGANASTRADASTAVNAIASGNSDVGTSTTFSFTLGSSDTMTISFNGNPYTRALVTPGSGPVSNANARLSWSIRIVDITTPAAPTTVLSFAPDALNADSNVSATDGLPNDLIYAPGSALYTATTPLLLAGRTYQLTVQHNSLANALQAEVPEPASLAVLAVGLLSMSMLRRRRCG